MMTALMVPVVTFGVGAQVAWLIAGAFLSVLLVAQAVRVPKLRMLAAFGVALVIAVGVQTVPQIIIRCPEWWIGCW